MYEASATRDGVARRLSPALVAVVVVVTLAACAAPITHATPVPPTSLVTLAPAPTQEVGDLDFARNALAALLRGDPSAEAFFDWPQLVIFGLRPGANWERASTEAERHALRVAFISSFAASAKGDISETSSWRIVSRDAGRYQTICDKGSAQIRMTVTTSGGVRKVVAVEVS